MSEDDAASNPLRGRSGWAITDGKAGMDVQAVGVAEALGLELELKHVKPEGLSKHLAPYGGVARSQRFGGSGAQFCSPWPDVAIATGRASIPYIRAIGRSAGRSTYRVVLQDPKTGPNTADLIWVPQHDTRRGPNVVTTLTAPHSFTQARLAQLRSNIPVDIARLQGPRIAVILGGKNAVYRYTEADDQRFQQALASLALLGASFLITPSRRTHKRLVRAVDQATANSPRILWDIEGDAPNPYADFLAHADIMVVTADSVNMCGEACATGKPVYVFEPSGGSAKFSRFHDGLRSYGATKALPDLFEEFETWNYQPLDSAADIALEIAVRWQRRQAMLPGLVTD